jgi:hypothetical protein
VYTCTFNGMLLFSGPCTGGGESFLLLRLRRTVLDYTLTMVCLSFAVAWS